MFLHRNPLPPCSCALLDAGSSSHSPVGFFLDKLGCSVFSLCRTKVPAAPSSADVAAAGAHGSSHLAAGPAVREPNAFLAQLWRGTVPRTGAAGPGCAHTAWHRPGNPCCISYLSGRAGNPSARGEGTVQGSEQPHAPRTHLSAAILHQVMAASEGLQPPLHHPWAGWGPPASIYAQEEGACAGCAVQGCASKAKLLITRAAPCCNCR